MKAFAISLASVAVAVAVAFAGGEGSVRITGVPVMVACVVVAFAIQWVAFVPAYLLRTERFYDLTGSFTYLTVIGIALVATDAVNLRSGLIGVAIGVWSLRLGIFLFRRVHHDGGDGRFDEIKQSGGRFFMAWSLQGLWVSLTLAAALAAITAKDTPAFGAIELLGLTLWLIGFSIEVISDRQKRSFRRDERNRGRFISTGLWSWSRHPNYFGEILLWIGIAIAAAPTLAGWAWVTLVSPVFVAVLLTRGSGIPILEARADERWGGEADYEAYKARTNVLVPLPPRS